MASHRAAASRAALLVLSAALTTPGTLRAQAPERPGLALQVTDARLAATLGRLIAGSPSAGAVIDALAASGLPVTIAAPQDAASETMEGATAVGALIPDASGLASRSDPQLAWVALGVSVPTGTTYRDTAGHIDRAWIVIDVDRIQALIRARDVPDADARLEDDLTIALGHELVAHVGSVAVTRRVEDFCDDPAPGGGAGAASACSIRVENVVRRELNRSFALHGSRRYVERTSYALEVMNFAGR